MAPDDPLIGAQFGRYHVEELLGEGGMARVYRAVLQGPMGFARAVAIKRIKAPGGDDADATRRVQSLINEARLGGHLSHPNVVDVLEFGESDGHFYIVMEHVDGPSLARVLARCEELGTAVPPGPALEILAGVARGLAYAHELEGEDGEPVGLIHRDLKPANVLLGSSGQAMVCDFGLAKSEANLFQSSTLEVKGTPAYMSPEQVACKPLTPASDLFSLGSILYEMLRGQPLFEADGVIQLAYQVARAELDEPREWVRERTPYLAPLFEGLTARDPGDRPATAREVERQLTDLLRGFPAGASVADLVAWVGDEAATAESLPDAGSYSLPSGSGTVEHELEGATSTSDAPPAAPNPARSRRVWLAALLVVALAATVGWAMGWYQRDEQAVAERRAEREAERVAEATGHDVSPGSLPDGVGSSLPVVPEAETETGGHPTATEAEAEVEAGGHPNGTERTMPIHPTEPPPQASLVIACIPWCDQVRVDGEGWGATPIRDRTAPVGRREVHLRAATGAEHTLTVALPTGGTKVCWDFEREGPCEGI